MPKFKKLVGRTRGAMRDFVSAIAVPQDGEFFLASDTSGAISAITATTLDTVWSRTVHQGGVMCLELLDSRCGVLSGGEDGILVQSDLHTGAEQHRKSMRSDVRRSEWVHRIALDPTGTHVAVSCGKRLFILAENLQPVGEPREHSGVIEDLTWETSGCEVVTVAYGGATVWRLDSNSPTKTWHDKVAMVATSWSPNRRFVSCGCQDSSLLVWDVEAKQNLRMGGYPGKVSLLSWERTGRYLATAGQGDLIVWDFSGKGPSGREPLTRSIHQGAITSLAFNARGTLLCTGADDGSVIVWRTGSFQPAMFGVAPAGVSTLRWSQSGLKLLVGQMDGGISVFGVE